MTSRHSGPSCWPITCRCRAGGAGQGVQGQEVLGVRGVPVMCSVVDRSSQRCAQDLKDVTSHTHYENYRTGKLTAMMNSGEVGTHLMYHVSVVFQIIVSFHVCLDILLSACLIAKFV